MEESGWYQEWYMAVVKKVTSYAEAKVKVTSVVEPSECYEVNMKQLLNEKLLTLYDGNELEQFYEIRARIKVKWTQEEIGDLNWTPGYYAGEVQESDPENDEITVQFVL